MMRHLFKSLIRPSLYLKAPKFGYAQDAKNVFVLPKKQNLQPAGINQVTSAIREAYTVKMLAYLFRDNIKFFLDLHVAAMFEHIAEYKLQVDDTMYSIIIPITIEYVKVFNFQNAASLGSIARAAAQLNLQSQALWEVLLQKLDGENCYRYLTLDQSAFLLNDLVKQGTFINHSLVRKLSNVVAEQKAYYEHNSELMGLIRETNRILEEKGEKTLQITQAYQQIA